LHDFRAIAPDAQNLPSPEQAVWYAEGVNLDSTTEQIPYAPRQDIPSGEHVEQLVVWSIPPSPRLLHWLIHAVSPNTIYLCGHHTADDSLSSVLRQVAGMGKFALSRRRPLNLCHMAARLGTTKAVIHASLLLLESRGTFEIRSWADNDSVEIQAGSTAGRSDQIGVHQTALAERLAEVRAYRRFFARASLSELGLLT
jgi:hypothetical protein